MKQKMKNFIETKFIFLYNVFYLDLTLKCFTMLFSDSGQMTTNL